MTPNGVLQARFACSVGTIGWTPLRDLGSVDAVSFHGHSHRQKGDTYIGILGTKFEMNDIFSCSRAKQLRTLSPASP